jgi:adenosylcobinamide-GDP ribazoletransferase
MNQRPDVPTVWTDFLSAIQFLTRIPVPSPLYREDSLSRAVKFFPVVGVLVGGSAAILYLLLVPHLPALVAAVLVLAYLVCLTGCFHEDALADAADGFFGGRDRNHVLLILRDSRIGSFGGAVLALSLFSRAVLIASLSPTRIVPVMIAAHVLCRWTTLPLSRFLPAARTGASDGQGARIARLTGTGSLVFGTLFSVTLVVFLLRRRSIAALIVATAITLFSGQYYKRRIGGITGDCFGATNQLTEIAVYLCGVWAV